MPPIRSHARPLVPYRVARLVSTAAALAVALTVQACVPASASGGIDSRFFGMHVRDLETSFPTALDGRVGAVDLTTNGVYWPSLEPSDNAWDFTRLDALVAQARQHGAKPLLVLGQTPSWLGSTPASPPDMTAWQDYVREVATQYGTTIDYEIWPEGNIKENWSGTPKQLAARVIAAARIIHQVTDGKAVVVSPAMVLRMQYQRAFMDKFFGAKVGGKRVGGFVDAIGLDPYPLVDGTPEDSITLIKQARAILHSHRVSAPLWNVEINYGVAGSHTGVNQGWSNRKQASYVVRNDVLDAAAGMKRVYWLGWFPFKEAQIQFVQSDGTTPTVAATALGVVRGWLVHQHARPCARDKKKHLYTCKLVRAGRASWVYWTTKGKTAVRAPKGSRHVATMLGDVSRTHAGKRIRVTSAPIRVYH
jgi:polysaccharide biosynthesis protein PslG